MTPTRAQLQSIEWAGNLMGISEPCCPACGRAQQHAPDCWLAAALAPQEAAPMPTADPPDVVSHTCGAMHFSPVRGDVCLACEACDRLDAPMPPIEKGDWVEGHIRIRAVLADRDVEWWNSSEAVGTRLGVTEIRKANGTVWRRPGGPR